MFDFETPIDWPRLWGAQSLVIRGPHGSLLDTLRGHQVYLATPIRAYQAAGELELLLARVAEWQALLLAWGLSPVAPALLTLPPVAAAADDAVGEALAGLSHRAWMQRCLPWIEGSSACLVPPIAGWAQSEGVWQEALKCVDLGRAVLLLEGDT